jgi:hypothetical protein
MRLLVTPGAMTLGMPSRSKADELNGIRLRGEIAFKYSAARFLSCLCLHTLRKG